MTLVVRYELHNAGLYDENRRCQRCAWCRQSIATDKMVADGQADFHKRGTWVISEIRNGVLVRTAPLQSYGKDQVASAFCCKSPN